MGFDDKDVIAPVFAKVKKLMRNIEAPIETREESNDRILRSKEHVLKVASMIEASTSFGYEKFQKFFQEDYVPSTKEILAVSDDGITSDWAPAHATLSVSSHTHSRTHTHTNTTTNEAEAKPVADQDTLSFARGAFRI